MAILRWKSLSLEIKFKAFTAGFDYEILFKWNDVPIINDEVLRRDWGSRSKGGILAHSFDTDGECFIPLIKKVLKTNKPVYWESCDPDIGFAIYPEGSFPFIEYNKEKGSYVGTNTSPEYLEWSKKFKEKWNMKDSYFIAVYADSFNFKDSAGFIGQGIAFYIEAERDVLEKFCVDLKEEYYIFLKEHKVHEYFVEEYGENYEEDEGIKLDLDDED